MKALAPLFFIPLTALLLSACGGPSKAELRAELQQIEAEMMQLEMMAYDARSRMSQADWQNFLGGFAAGFGVVSGDDNMALTGGHAIAGATGDYDRARFNLQQIQGRYNQLAQRRFEILRILQ
jgi:hypothetical protein